MSKAEGPPSLRYLSVGELVAGAGGDPWQVNASLQSGDPGQIASLAEAFYLAGVCTEQTDDQFTSAKLRFQHAWNHEQPEHPINDSREVQRATDQMHLQKTQLSAVGADMEQIAASLAEAQAVAAPVITGLNTALTSIDNQIGVAIANHANQANIDSLRNSAVATTRQALGELQSIREGYESTLTDAMTRMRGLDGYDPMILQGYDADGKPTVGDQTLQAADRYNSTRRAADEALVNSGGPMTPEKQQALARLRDLATVNDPKASPQARFLAGERLDDFNKAGLNGPWSAAQRDPVLGTDPASRARTRLELQSKLEQGLLGGGPMTPDQATAMLDQSEEQARVMVTQKAIGALERQGMSPQGAIAAVDGLSRGISWEDLTKMGQKGIGPVGAGLEGAAKSLPTGAHDWVRFSEGDVRALETIGKRVSRAGDALEVWTALQEWSNGAPAGKTFGGAGGSIAGGLGGGWVGGAALGSFAGPEGALLGGILFAAAGSAGGKWVGEHVGELIDELAH